MQMAQELKEQSQRYDQVWDRNLKLTEVNDVLQGRQRTLESQLDALREEITLKNTQIAQLGSQLKDKKASGAAESVPSALHRLQQELDTSKLAADAHRTQNAFLERTIQQLVDDKAIEAKAKAAKTQHLREELELRRQEILELRSSIFSGNGPQLTRQYMKDHEELQREFFFALALGIKLNRMVQGQSTNLDVARLWEQARHLHFSEWNRWIQAEVSGKHQAAPSSGKTNSSAPGSTRSASSTR